MQMKIKIGNLIVILSYLRGFTGYWINDVIRASSILIILIYIYGLSKVCQKMIKYTFPGCRTVFPWNYSGNCYNVDISLLNMRVKIIHAGNSHFCGQRSTVQLIWIRKNSKRIFHRPPNNQSAINFTTTQILFVFVWLPRQYRVDSYCLICIRTDFSYSLIYFGCQSLWVQLPFFSISPSFPTISLLALTDFYTLMWALLWFVSSLELWTLWQPQVQKSNQNQNYGNPSQFELKQKLLFDLLIYWPSRQKSVLYYGFYHILLIICLQEKTI